jgi:hypothetical protein
LILILLTIIVIISYVLIHSLEIFSFAARVAGRITHMNALGTTISQTVYTTATIALITFLPSLAYLVESGISLKNYIILVILAYFFTFLASLIMLINLNKLQHFFQTVFIIYNKNTLPIAILKSLFNKNKEISLKDCEKFSFDKVVCKKTAVSFLAYIFLITGYFNAFLLAVLFPENRLTLSQFTSIFHGVGAIIFAFYIDPMVSRSIDTYSDDVSWLKNVYSILIGRMMSYLVMISFFLILLVIFEF